MNLLEIGATLILAISLGGIIGLEREIHQKPAGFRTNILICVGSAMLMVLARTLLHGKGGDADSLVRMAAGVITGIGFIGAGTIIQARGTVFGLTTAATLWIVAALGLVIGAGEYLYGLVFAVFIILTLIGFRKIEESFLKRHLFHYDLKMKESPELLGKLRKLSFHFGIKLEGLTWKKEKDIIHIRFSFSATEEKEQQFSEAFYSLGEILELRID